MEGKHANGKSSSKKSSGSTEKNNKKSHRRRKKHKSNSKSREKGGEAGSEDVKAASSSSPEGEPTDAPELTHSDCNQGAESDSSSRQTTTKHNQSSGDRTSQVEPSLFNQKPEIYTISLQKAVSLNNMPSQKVLQLKNKNNNYKSSRPKLPPETKCVKPLSKTLSQVSSHNSKSHSGVVITTGLSTVHINNASSSRTSCRTVNESLRWEYKCDDSDEEKERIKIYKMNRRKRYLAAAQSRNSCWESGVSSSSSNGSLENENTSQSTPSPPPAAPAMRTSQETFIRSVVNAAVPLSGIHGLNQNRVSVM